MRQTKQEIDPLDLALERLHRLEYECEGEGHHPDGPFMRGIAAAIIVIGQLQTEEIIKEQLLNARIQKEGKGVRR